METKNENMHKKKIHYGVIFSFSFERSLKGCGKNFSFFLFQKLPCNWNIISWNILRQYWRLNFFISCLGLRRLCVWLFKSNQKEFFLYQFFFFHFLMLIWILCRNFIAYEIDECPLVYLLFIFFWHMKIFFLTNILLTFSLTSLFSV